MFLGASLDDLSAEIFAYNEHIHVVSLLCVSMCLLRLLFWRAFKPHVEHKYSLLLHLCVLLEFFGSCKLHTVHFIFWCTCLWFNHFLFPVKFLLHSSQGYSLSASWQFLMCCFIDCLVLNVLPQVSQMKEGSIVSEEFSVEWIFWSDLWWTDGLMDWFVMDWWT